MTSLIGYRKEFEDIILKGKLEESLKTLVPNSSEYTYIKFCEEYKKCCAEKKITPELNTILESAKAKRLPNRLITVLETKRDLLEYDLPSTSKEKKDKIIDELYKNFCGSNLNFDAPFFVREKKTKTGEKVKDKNNTPTELTEKMIKDAVQKDLKKNERDNIYKIRNMPEKNRHKYFAQLVDKDQGLCIKILKSGVKILFYLMTKDEFKKVINLCNQTKERLDSQLFHYENFTVEQIERLIKEVKNEMYINRGEIVNFLINKKYDKLINKSKKNNDLKQLKKLLWEIYDIYSAYLPEYTPGILLYILKINKQQNILELKPFIEYIKNPIKDRLLYDQKNFYKNKITNNCSHSLINIPSIDFYEINKHKFIEELLIDFLINDKAKPKDFNNYFNQDYLDKLECISKMYKGETINSEACRKHFSDSEYEELVKKTEITICEHNPKQFKIDEEVKIDFDFKNIKEINLSIYEINTENYYLEKKAPLTSLINVEGIIASKTMDIKIEGGENPLKRIRKNIHLDQIPKGKPGVFLVEILGGGFSSRIIIKRGRLNLISRNTSKGILCQMIDEKNEVLKDDKTYLWYNGLKFTCEPKEGLIILPYKALVDSTNQVILVHDNYADITEIKRKTENYTLKGYFNLLNESIIPGNMLKVNFKPILFANGRETSLELIKKGTITVNISKIDNEKILPISTVFEDISFKDDNKEYEFEVMIPPMMTIMNFTFTCEVNNPATGEKRSLSYNQDSNFQSCNSEISRPLFHKVGKNYIYEVLGRNGEHITTKSGTNANIEIKTNYHLSSIYVSLQYDQEGKLNLGELKNVLKIKLDNNWYNLDQFSKYCYPERIDIIQGESFTLPLYSASKVTLDDDYFQLFECLKSQYEKEVSSTKDVKKEIVLNELNINGEKEHYYEFTLGHKLPKGSYILTFGNDNDKTSITIKVKEGTHWMNLENYIINDKGFIENSQIKTPIYMKNLVIDKEKGEIKFECAKTRRDIKYTHANIYLSQYQCPNTNIYFNHYYNMLNVGVENLITSKFSQWKNIYLSNRILNEEIEYVLQRRTLENQMGNSLPTPSLLLKRAYKRDCENEEEKLEKGNEYKKMDADLGKGAGGTLGRKREDGLTLKNTDFFNFLKYSGYALNNIEPKNINAKEDSAKFEIKFDEKEKDILKKYSYIQIILVDNKSISSDLHCLCKDNDKFEVEKRNISNEKALDSNKNISEIKKTELIKKGEKFNINETSDYKLVDSVQKLSKFYLLTLSENDLWNKFKFLLNLNDDKFNEEEFLEKYNEVCGHEVNLFLYFKYPKIFNKYVKDIIKYKFEKTFIDYFLLDDYETLIQYLTPLKIKTLPTDELCLLMLKIIEKKPEEAKKIRDIIKSRVKKPEEVENLLLTNFNIMMNMKVEEDSNLEVLKEEIEAEECCIEKECYEEPQEEMPMLGMSNRIMMNNNMNNMNNMNMYANSFIQMNQMAMPMAAGMAMNMAPRPMPMMAANFLNCAPMKNNSMMNMCQADFIGQERTKAFKGAFEKAIKEMGEEFEKPGVAKEYKERHYYIQAHKNQNIENPLWLDFAEHILKNKSFENFLSKYVLYNTIDFNEFLLILSVIGLPVESLKHEYNRIPGSRFISITLNSNLILFTKELTETQLSLNNKLLISQNVADEVHNEMIVNTNNCVVGITYSHQSIVTNISNKSINFELFIQIPQGAICLDSTYYTNSIKLKLNPYQTQNHKTFFYFPNEGKYPQYHPVACKNSTIISVGSSLTYDVKKEYTPSKKNEIVENNKYAKDMRVDGKLRNILSDDSIDSKAKLTNIIKYFENDIFNEEDVRNVFYLLKNDKDFYNNLINTLRKRGYFNPIVWSFGFHHKDETAVREYLKTNESLKRDLGYDFTSTLYSYSDIDDAKIQPHLEYSPLYNARKHPFGNKGDKNETNIANKEFNETYRRFIVDLLALKQLTIREKLQLTYYLILQDRMDEALEMYKKIKPEEVNDNNNKSYKIQYDYINAYLDFCFGYPDFTIAKSICDKYKDFPLTNWREKFEEIEDELFEYEGKEKVSMNKISTESEDKKALSKELREKEPKLSFTVDSKEGKILLIHSNVNEINIKFYFIDLETMFTRDPKISEIMNKDKNKENNSNNNMMESFGFVQANYSETIKIPKEKVNKNDNSTMYEIPKEYKNKNLFVEITSESIKLFDIYLSSNLFIVITESLGELKVIDNNLKPIIKAYVKVYVELNNNSEVQFYKDGYTDLNGKFNYLALNTDQLKNSKKFYIFVSEEKQGAIIKECYPPKNVQRTDNLLGDIQKYRQNQRNEWRKLNKI